MDTPTQPTRQDIEALNLALEQCDNSLAKVDYRFIDTLLEFLTAIDAKALPANQAAQRELLAVQVLQFRASNDDMVRAWREVLLAVVRAMKLTITPAPQATPPGAAGLS
jgi:hypothetical protein